MVGVWAAVAVTVVQHGMVAEEAAGERITAEAEVGTIYPMMTANEKMTQLRTVVLPHGAETSQVETAQPPTWRQQNHPVVWRAAQRQDVAATLK